MVRGVEQTPVGPGIELRKGPGRERARIRALDRSDRRGAIGLALLLLVSVVFLGGNISAPVTQQVSTEVAFHENFEDPASTIANWNFFGTAGTIQRVPFNNPPKNHQNWHRGGTWTLWMDSLGPTSLAYAVSQPPYALMGDYIVTLNFRRESSSGIYKVVDDGFFGLRMSGVSLQALDGGTWRDVATLLKTQWYLVEVRGHVAGADYEVYVDELWRLNAAANAPAPGSALTIGDDLTGAGNEGQAYWDAVIVADLHPEPWSEDFSDGNVDDWTRILTTGSIFAPAPFGPTPPALQVSTTGVVAPFEQELAVYGFSPSFDVPHAYYYDIAFDFYVDAYSCFASVVLPCMTVLVADGNVVLLLQKNPGGPVDLYGYVDPFTLVFVGVIPFGTWQHLLIQVDPSAGVYVPQIGPGPYPFVPVVQDPRFRRAPADLTVGMMDDILPGWANSNLYFDNFEVYKRTPPVLDWCGTTGFTADGVDPDDGDTLSSFHYCVKYSDADNDGPWAGYPVVDIARASTGSIPGSPFAMTPGAFVSGTPGDYVGGQYFDYSTGLAEGLDYGYTFSAYDVTFLPAVDRGPTNGPQVYRLPQLSLCTGAGYGGVDGVHPDDGDTLTGFAYCLRYDPTPLDDPTNPATPGVRPEVVIDGGAQPMTCSGTGPYDCTYGPVTLTAAPHDYRFQATNRYGHTVYLPDPPHPPPLPLFNTLSGPRVYNLPTLELTCSGYGGIGVSPDNGAPLTPFPYCVTYTPTGGDAPETPDTPASYRTQLSIDGGALQDPTSCTGSAPTYTCTWSPPPFSVTGNHNYRFEVTNRYGHTVYLPDPPHPPPFPQYNTLPGPTVYGLPQLDVCPGYGGDGVTPDEGDTNTLFTFCVRFTPTKETDLSNRPAQVAIDTLPLQSMTCPAPSPSLCITSPQTMGGGTHQHRFEATNEYGHSDYLPEPPPPPYNWFVGPVVHPLPTLDWCLSAGYGVNDGVNPDEDETGSAFTYCVKYRQADGIGPPTWPLVLRIFKGPPPTPTEDPRSPFTMTCPPGSDFQVGAECTSAPIPLDFGGLDYSFRFEASTPWTSPAATLSGVGPGVFDPPTLDWCTSQGYGMDDGVDPNQGGTDTDFTYCVVYRQNQNDPPNELLLHIRKNGNPLPGLGPFPLGCIGSTYDTGVECRYTTKLPQPGNDYTYEFRETSRFGHVESLSGTGPIVGNPPVLGNCDVSPTYGLLGSTFVFRVTYSDPDNDPPASGYPKLYISQGWVTVSPFLMDTPPVPESWVGGVGDFVAGATYRKDLSTELGVGDHKRYCQSSDGAYVVATPEVWDPFVYSDSSGRGSWWKFHKNLPQAGVTSDEGPDNGTLAWWRNDVCSFGDGCTTSSSPVVDDGDVWDSGGNEGGRVFIGGSKSQKVYSYTMAGVHRWTTAGFPATQTGQIAGAPAAVNGRVYVLRGNTNDPPNDCQVHSLDVLMQKGGMERFHLDLPCGARDSSVAVDNLALYFATWFYDAQDKYRGRVYKIRETDFSTEWTYETPAGHQFLNSPLVTTDGVVVVSGNRAIKLPKTDPSSPTDYIISESEVLWKNTWCTSPLRFTTFSSPVLAGLYTVFGSGECSSDVGLVRLDLSTGAGGVFYTPLGAFTLHGTPAYESVGQQVIYGFDHPTLFDADSYSSVGRIGLFSGSPLWETRTHHGEVGRSSPAVTTVTSSKAYVSAGGYLMAFDYLTGGFSWQYQTDGSPDGIGGWGYWGSSPAVVGGYLFVGSHSSKGSPAPAGFLYAFKDT